MEDISRSNHVRNEEVLRRVKERNILHTIKKKEEMLTGVVTVCVGTAL